jgi:hypothetical protein
MGPVWVVCAQMTNPQPISPAEPRTDVPPTYLGWAVASMALCFLPLGLVAVWFAWRTAGRIQSGELAAARRSSAVARRWLVATIVLGVLLDLGLLAVLGLLGAFPTGAAQ